MKDFGELLFQVLDDTLRQVLGETASELIYRLMDRQVMVKREEIGEKIEVFYAFLEKLLGSGGAQVIRAASLKRLCIKLRREYEEIENYFSFLDQLYEAKFKLLMSLLEERRSVCN